MDGRELEAVNRASDRSWNEFPYYDARFDRLSKGFDEATADVAPFSGMGMLLVSAVCDEALGIEHAVSNIVNWVEERGYDRERWISAIRSTIEKARAQLS
jgi:hypothetical protein